MALGPIINLPLVPVSTGERRVPVQPNEADGGRSRTGELDPSDSRFVRELRASDPRAEQQNRQRQNPIPLEEISADLPRGSILDITV